MATAEAGAQRRGIGARLQAGRELAGLSLLQAAEKLHVDPQVIAALENERFEELGAAVFVRGHLRHYAQLLREDADELLGLYAASAHGGATPSLNAFPKAAHRTARGSGLLIPGLAIVIAVGLIGSIWWVYNDLRGATPAPAPAATEHHP